MKYSNIIKGEFISRPNRFIANVKIENEIHTVHVKNTGRCKELLVPNCTVYLSGSDNPNRKTKYDLIAVEKERKKQTSSTYKYGFPNSKLCGGRMVKRKRIFR